MKRWNGWGDESIDFPLPKSALQFLIQHIGKASPLSDAAIDSVRTKVPPSRLPDHPLINKEPTDRLLHARGQSFPDWVALRTGRVDSFPDGVAYPETSEDIRQLLSYAKASGAAVIPYGGGTSVVGHINPPHGDRPVLTIDMGRMNRLLDLDEESLIATFQAGATGPEVESQLRAHGHTLGHFPQSFEYSTLGGWVATRSSGQQSYYYGRIEQLFAGGLMETPSGTLEIPPFPASAAGPDVREMVLGSEGRIGILTEIKVRIQPIAKKEGFHVIFLPSWPRALEVVRSLVQEKMGLSMVRLSNPMETKTLLTLSGSTAGIRVIEKFLSLRGIGNEKCMLTFGVTGPGKGYASLVRRTFRMCRPYAGRIISGLMGKKWKKTRFRAPYLRNSLWDHGYAVDTLESAITWDKVDLLVRSVEDKLSSALASSNEKVHCFTHLSHIYPTGSSIYTTYIFRVGKDPEQTLERWKTLKASASEAIISVGGTISHHHGIGTDHAPYLASEKGALGVGAIRSLCQYFDPNNIMNPGKLIE